MTVATQELNRKDFLRENRASIYCEDVVNDFDLA